MIRAAQTSWRLTRGLLNVCGVVLCRRKPAMVDQPRHWRRRAAGWREEVAGAAQDSYYADFDHRLVQTLADLPVARRVLEVGCFFGHRLAMVQRALPQTMAIGVDIVFEGLRSAQAPGAPTPHLVNGDALRLPFRSDSVDCVYTSVCLTHIPECDVGTALDEMVRVSHRYVALVEVYDRVMKLRPRLRVWAWTDGYCHAYPALLQRRGLRAVRQDGWRDASGHPRFTLFLYEKAAG